MNKQILIEDVNTFAESFKLPIVIFENEGHSLGGCQETPERVADLAISFFSEEAENSGKY